MQNLLRQPPDNIVLSISKVLAAIDQAAPIPRAHKRHLPDDIRELSALLTEDRGSMGRPYWASVKLFSAYVHYFLPWNLYRLSWLLPSLSLPLQEKSVILDLGSGPLTLPLALWCARPDLRDVPLHFICTDVATQPMDMGLAIFQNVSKETAPWTFDCVKAPVEAALSRMSGRADCIMAGNVLNELQPSKGQTLAERIAGVVHAASRKLSADGMLLLVEPGTRLGGKVIALARETGVELGMPVLAPCTHHNPCPLCSVGQRDEFYGDMHEGFRDMQGRSRRLSPEQRQALASQSNMWCHFSFPVQGAPARLSRLTSLAKFDRRSLALSCVVLGAPQAVLPAKNATLMAEFDELELLYEENLAEDAEHTNQSRSMTQSLYKTVRGAGQPSGNAELDREVRPELMMTIQPPLWARIISGPIRLPYQTEPARYACSAAGLMLVRQCSRIPHGGAVPVTWDTVEYDSKSGALLVDPVMEESEGAGGRKTAGRDKTGGRRRRAEFDKEHVKGNKPQSGGQDDPEQETGFGEFFSRPRKMRERYGAFPAQTQEDKPDRDGKPSKKEDKSKGKPSGKSSGKALGKASGRRSGRSADRPARKKSGGSDKMSDKLSGKPLDRPSGKASDKPSGTSSGRSSNKPSDKMPGKSSGTSSGKSPDKPSVRRSGKSGENPRFNDSGGGRENAPARRSSRKPGDQPSKSRNKPSDAAGGDGASKQPD